MKAQVTLPVTATRIQGSSRYSIRLGGLKVAEVSRDPDTGWFWDYSFYRSRCIAWEEEQMGSLVDAIHVAMGSTSVQRNDW